MSTGTYKTVAGLKALSTEKLKEFRAAVAAKNAPYNEGYIARMDKILAGRTEKAKAVKAPKAAKSEVPAVA